MRSILIVTGKPFLSKLTYLLKRMKQIQIENILAIGSVKALDVGILGRFSRLNELDEDMMALCPCPEGRRQEFWTIIDPHSFRIAAPGSNPIQCSGDTEGRQRRIDFNG